MLGTYIAGLWCCGYPTLALDTYLCSMDTLALDTLALDALALDTLALDTLALVLWIP